MTAISAYSKKLGNIKNIFRTLRYRNFRLFFMGQSVSLIGTWMQQVAMSWLVYRLTDSPLMLGVIGFSSQIPTFAITPFAGVFVDRFNRRRILIVAQVLFMLQAFLLAALTLTNTVTVLHVILLSLFFGCICAIEIPARQSFVVEMVEKKENLGNAIALNSFMFNSARLIGPSVAGILIAVTGEGACFLMNGLSFVAVIISLMLMNTHWHKKNIAHPHVLVGLKEGFTYTFGSEPIRYILLLLSVNSAIGASYVVLMPIFAKQVLKGGPATLGFLMASAGVGAMVATLYLASRKSILGLGKLIPISSSIFALGIILFSLSNIAWLSFCLLALIGFGFMVNMAASNTILQTISDDDKRGRVMSFYTMAFMGMAPIGSLLAGYLAARIGVTRTLIIGGVICLYGAILFARRLPAIRKLIHPIYLKIGIISEQPTRP